MKKQLKEMIQQQLSDCMDNHMDLETIERLTAILRNIAETELANRQIQLSMF